VAALVLGSALVVAWVYSKYRQPHSSPEQQNAYVNAAVFTGCHADLGAGFLKTGMGRSFARLRPENIPEFGKPFHHKASDSYFAMVARDGRYYQRRWQIDLHRAANGALQVLPLSCYSEEAPGGRLRIAWLPTNSAPVA
jgi:hypothetical protein